MNPEIAIVGMACCYADARTPQALWENALTQRRAFRRIPAERLGLEDYFSSDPAQVDAIYAREAAVIADYEFDRLGFRVAGPTLRVTDWAHWLALDVAAQALTDAGWLDTTQLPQATSGVIVGNTLTGEFSRANVMRLRWPYVQRVVEAELRAAGWQPEQCRDLLLKLEAHYKAPFPAMNAESLAGGLSNTIAGRICNHFNLNGGGYTVDAACASSLLAISNACSSLLSGDLDLALAGGVDLSIDPFELVGFARAGALTADVMRVFDRRANGFLPGEGCGFVVLMRQADAQAQGCRIYATIRGWGVSSDGSGGMTRPESDGQQLALTRAYRRAGFGIDSVGYFEAHGTGTALGDTVELQALSTARKAVNPAAVPAVISSLKANIGHTKAAAGIAGLIKATLALYTQILPPATSCQQPHALLLGGSPALRVLSQGIPWPEQTPLRAGVSAMGFGGINTHIVLEGDPQPCPKVLTHLERRLLCTVQDAELFVFAAADAQKLKQQIDQVSSFASQLSYAELSDLAAQLALNLTPSPLRAALIANTPSQLAERLQTLQTWLDESQTGHLSPVRLDVENSLFLGIASKPPRIGLLFPGQAAPVYLEGGLWQQRFETVQTLYGQGKLPTLGDPTDTALAQTAIVTGSIAALRVLAQVGIQAQVAVGHSLGELTALHWAGALDEAALLRIVEVRGKSMRSLGDPNGGMVSIRAPEAVVRSLVKGGPTVIACLNSPVQHVVAGENSAIAKLMARAQQQGVSVSRLPVGNAFHSPLVAAAVAPLAVCLASQHFNPLRRTVVSTVTGATLPKDIDLHTLLTRQVTEPVLFAQALQQAAATVDLWIEAGPGEILSRLSAEMTKTPVVAVDAGGDSLVGLLKAIAAAFVLGAPLQVDALFVDRFTRPFDLNWQPHFFANPCEETRRLGDRETGRQGDTAGEIGHASCVGAVCNRTFSVPGPERAVTNRTYGIRQHYHKVTE